MRHRPEMLYAQVEKEFFRDLEDGEEVVDNSNGAIAKKVGLCEQTVGMMIELILKYRHENPIDFGPERECDCYRGFKSCKCEIKVIK